MEEYNCSDTSKVPLQTVFINANKISTLIPNRIFVGGFPANTTEGDLREFFAKFGMVKDVKIIPDKGGQSKGSYGFVTFESQDIAEKMIAEQAESLVFRDRKLNIGRAVKKQPLTPKSELQNTLLFNPMSLAYSSMYPYQDYSYLFNQDLSGLYQNYASILPQLSILPSLLSPLISSSDTLGITLSQYQQLQSLMPFSLTQSYSGLSPCTTPVSSNDNITSCLTDSFSIAALLSTNNDASLIDPSETIRSSNTSSISSPFQSYESANEIKTECKVFSKLPFTPITNQSKETTNSHKSMSSRNGSSFEGSEQPKKKIKYEESVTRSGEPVHYIHPD